MKLTAGKDGLNISPYSRAFALVKAANKHFYEFDPIAGPIKLLFLHYPIFAVKPGHFNINYFFLYVTNKQAQ